MGYVRGNAYRIVVGFDFTELGYLALHGAINTAIATPGAELHILGVVSPGFGLGPVRTGDVEAVDEVQLHMESVIGIALSERDAQHVPYYAHARISGAPAVAIVELANEQNAEFIVVGTHGRHGIDRFVHGSTAEHIVRDADCPVLVMRHKIEHRETDELREPPCEACLQRRHITEGAEMWCDTHRRRAVAEQSRARRRVASGTAPPETTNEV